MAVIVDTNIILDVITDDPNWASWSIEILETYFPQGLVINPAIYAELCYGFENTSGVDELVKNFGLIYKEIPRSGLFKAAKAFRSYKSRSGPRNSALPDFFIGGHAEASEMTLLTRDTKRYQTYFPSVQLVCP